MKIGHKLVLGFMVIAGLTAVVGYIGLHSAKQISSIYDKIGEEMAPELVALGEIKSSLNKMEMEAMGASLVMSELKAGNNTTGGIEHLQDAKKTIAKWKTKYAKIATDAEGKIFLEQVHQHSENLFSAAMAMIDAKKDGKAGQHIIDLKNKIEIEEEALNKLIAKATARVTAEFDKSNKDADAITEHAMTEIVAIGLGAIILAVGGGYAIARTISKPIAKLKEATIEIAKGDWNKRADVTTKDEVGTLAESFNHMTDELQKRDEELQTMNEELRSANEELETYNEELQSTTEELEASNEELRVANEQIQQTQEELMQQEKLAAVGQLASGIGHELRNPLGVIKNAVYYIKSKIGTQDEKLVKHLKIVEREVNNSNKIINDLLGFSRRKMPTVVPNDTNAIIDGALEVVEKPENVLLVKDFDTKLQKIEADKDQIHQVIVNLAMNAIQAMTNGGQLTIQTKATGEFVEVNVSDTGCGIAEENMKKLFDPFFTTKAKGVGLGLAVTYGIIEKHKGTIEVKSIINKGTTFTVKLPVVKAQSSVICEKKETMNV